MTSIDKQKPTKQEVCHSDHHYWFNYAMYYDMTCFSVTRLSFVSVLLKTKALRVLLSSFALQCSLSFPSVTIEDLNILRVHQAVICLLIGTIIPFVTKPILVLIVRDEELKVALEGLDGVRIKYVSDNTVSKWKHNWLSLTISVSELSLTIPVWELSDYCLPTQHESRHVPWWSSPERP